MMLLNIVMGTVILLLFFCLFFFYFGIVVNIHCLKCQVPPMVYFNFKCRWRVPYIFLKKLECVSFSLNRNKAVCVYATRLNAQIPYWYFDTIPFLVQFVYTYLGQNCLFTLKPCQDYPIKKCLFFFFSLIDLFPLYHDICCPYSHSWTLKPIQYVWKEIMLN